MAKRRRLEGIPRFSFERRWLRVFGAGIPKEKLRRYVEGQYIWHAFSWRLLDAGVYLEGDAAMKAFAQVNKENTFCLLPFERKRVIPLPSEFRDPHESNGSCGEIYVVPEDFAWTYIKTHEGDFCGPYFMRCEAGLEETENFADM